MYAAGSAVAAIGDSLAANLTILTAGVSAHTGVDRAGEVFGLGYQDSAESMLKAAAGVVNACRKCGALIQQGASNYSAAEAASTLGGGSGALPAPSAPADLAAPGPPGTWGKGEPPPLLWAVIQALVSEVWPDGDVAGLHAAASRWHGFAAAMHGVQGTLNASKALFDSQQIPEGEKIDHALAEIGAAAAAIGQQCDALARTVDEFADRVGHAQQAIRDLLHRIEALGDIGHDIMLIIDGDAWDEIQKIARDVNAVLQHLGQEARAFEQEIRLLMQAADREIVTCQKYARRGLITFLGEDVGNPVATALDFGINVQEGVVKGAVGMGLGLVDLSPHWIALDPEGAGATWGGLVKNAWKESFVNAAVNPQEFAQARLQELKGLVHADDWTRDRPGLGAGEVAFDAATLIAPGLGEAGAAADGASAAARGAEAEADAAGAAGRVGGLAGARGALTDIAKSTADLPKNLEGVTKDLPEIKPPTGGAPVVLGPGGKPIEAPVESAPRPPDGTPGAQRGSPPVTTSPASPGPAGDSGAGPHGPSSSPAPAAPPGGPVGPHDPAPAPAPAASPDGPGGSGGVHDPAPAPAPAAPFGGSGGPHDPVAEPAPAPAPAASGGPGDPVSVPSGAPHEPASVPAEEPREPVSVPAGGVHDPVAEPTGGPHEPASVPAAGSRLASVQAAAGDGLPSATPQLFDHTPSQVPVSAGGSSGEAASVGAHSPSSASSAAPHFESPGGRPSEVPAPNGGAHGPGESGPPGGHPPGEPPHGGKPSGDGGPPDEDSHPDGTPGNGDDGAAGEIDDGPAGDDGQSTPAKVAGVDYPLPPSDALRVLEHPGAELQRLADGGVPSSILEGYEPLAGRSVDDFNREFTIETSNGERGWDWEAQAPENGFAGNPIESNHIPAGLHFDRIGPNGGGFLSPEGVPLAERATPPGLAAQYHVFEGTGREIPAGKDWVVQHGPAKEAFGQPGGGDQWIVLDRATNRPVPVDELIRRRLLREITPPK